METVECYAGSAYPEQPTAFWWQGERLEVKECLNRWHSPGQRGFRIRTTGNEIFNLVFNEGSNDWLISPIDQ